MAIVETTDSILIPNARVPGTESRQPGERSLKCPRAVVEVPACSALARDSNAIARDQSPLQYVKNTTADRTNPSTTFTTTPALNA